MRTERVFDAGYALLTDGDEKTRTWKYRNEEITLRAGAVAEIDHKGLKAKIAHIEGIRTAQEAARG